MRSMSKKRDASDNARSEKSIPTVNSFKARPFKLKHKKPFMTMKSTKRLTIPRESNLQTERRGGDRSASKELSALDKRMSANTI